jgi:hypothetical protein
MTLMRAFGHIHKKRGRIGAAAHAVVAGTKAAADDDGELGHIGRGHGGDHLGAVAGDAFVLVLAAHHEAGDVLQKHQRDLALAAQLDEVRALQGRLAEQDAVVGDDAHRHAFDVGKAGDQRGAKARLELVELGAIDDAGNDLAHVKGLAGVGGDHTVQLFCCIFRSYRRTNAGARGLFLIQVGDRAAGNGQRMQVVLRQMVGHAGEARVHIATAQVFGRHHLAGGGLHQRRATQKDGALVLDDDGLVAHGRHIGAAAVQLPMTTAICAMPCALMLAWLKKMRPKWSRSGKTSSWFGRLAPPESTR